MQSVVARQVPVTLEWKKYPGKKKQAESSTPDDDWSTSTPQTKSKKEGPRTYASDTCDTLYKVAHAPRKPSRQTTYCTENKNNRKKITTRRRKIEIKIEKITHPPGTRENVQVRQGNNRNNEIYYKRKHTRECANFCRLQARTLREGCRTETSIRTRPLKIPDKRKKRVLTADKYNNKKDEAKQKSKAKNRRDIIARSKKAKRKIQTETQSGTNGKKGNMERWNRRDTKGTNTGAGGKDDTKGRHWSIETRKVA